MKNCFKLFLFIIVKYFLFAYILIKSYVREINGNYRLTFRHSALSQESHGSGETNYMQLIYESLHNYYIQGKHYTARACHRDSRGRSDLGSRNSRTSSRDFIEI